MGALISDEKRKNLFTDISEGKALLFLGAGSSVTNEKIYLSKHLIEYYRDIANIPYQPENNDIVDFVDKVFSLDGYDRDHFDLKVAEWLKNLEHKKYHSKLFKFPWLSIITTNVDLIIENTIEEDERENEFEFIRSLKELNATINFGDKKKVVKLHGCISDLGKYKLKFSSDDFERINKFYKRIFNAISGMSPSIKIVFIGYSFNDRFGNLLLNRFNEKLKGKECYLVDPFAKDDQFNLSYMESKNITLIKTSTEDFINEYHDWTQQNHAEIGKKNLLFKDTKGIRIDSYLQAKLDPFLKQIDNSFQYDKIHAQEFYLGEEPNYSVIKQNLDVIKKDKLKEMKSSIESLFKVDDISYPLVFLTGSYGTGKTTFTYRLIQHLLEENSDLLVFEITDTNKLTDKVIYELLERLEETNKIIFYSNHSELDLNFKRIRELRGNLSSKQYENKSIIFLQSIRENALERFKRKMNPKIYEYSIDTPFSDLELNDFVEKLNSYSIKSYRSELEKTKIISDLKANLKLNDQLLISLYLIGNGNHSRHIIETYKNFESSVTRKAFLYTSLLYRFGIAMPVNILKEVLDLDWDIFINEVIKVDGKGIFIQEQIKPDYYLKPDLYFKIKHPIVAETFINKEIKDKDLFNYYRNLVSSLSEDETSVNTFINLIKSLKDNGVFDQSKINYLYDLAYNKLSYFTRFNIYYSRNLQFRNSEKSLLKALDILKKSDYDSYSYKRNSQIVHRQACVNYDLAKYYYVNKPAICEDYFNEAYELFEIKLAIDPNSIFSYKNFIYMLMWYIRKWDLSDLEKIRTEIKISNIVKKGIDNLQEGLNKLLKINETYIDEILSNKIEVNERIDSLVENIETRPFGILLKLKVLERYPNNLPSNFSFNDLLEELEQYSYVEEVAYYLFNYYGENLNFYDIRIKFFGLIKNNETLFEKEELSKLYYNFIAESYSLRFSDAFKYQRLIQKKYKSALIKSPLFWLEQDSEEKRIFKGVVQKNKWDYFEFRVSNMGFKFKAKLRNSYVINNDINLKTEYDAYLKFTYSGIWADLIIITDDKGI